MTKICAVISTPSAIEEARRQGAEAFEFRLDLFKNLEEDLSFVAQPELTIATIRSREDAGRRELFEKAIASGVDYVDIESDSVLRDAFPGRTICSYHDFAKTPTAEAILEMCADLATSGIPKAAFLVHSPKDLLAIAEAAEVLRAKATPFILIGMGDAGKLTRVRAGMLGSMVSYCAVSPESGSAPGQLTVADAARLGANPTVCGVIGYPLKKTFSPAIHQAAFEAAGIRGAYVKIPTPEDEVSLIPEMMRRYALRGLNVTIPHKQAVLPLMNHLSPAAETIQAVNTIIQDGESLAGENTDWIGIAHTLDRFEPQGKNALLLGAGGAAFSAAFYLREAGAKLTVANRTPEKADALAKRFGGEAIAVDQIKPVYDIVINASPVCPAAASSFAREGVVVMDMVYPDSPLLQAAGELGAETFSGMTMLISQGAASFEFWHGVSPDISAMSTAFREEA